MYMWYAVWPISDVVVMLWERLGCHMLTVQIFNHTCCAKRTISSSGRVRSVAD